MRSSIPSFLSLIARLASFIAFLYEKVSRRKNTCATWIPHHSLGSDEFQDDSVNSHKQTLKHHVTLAQLDINFFSRSLQMLPSSSGVLSYKNLILTCPCHMVISLISQSLLCSGTSQHHKQSALFCKKSREPLLQPSTLFIESPDVLSTLICILTIRIPSSYSTLWQSLPTCLKPRFERYFSRLPCFVLIATSTCLLKNWRISGLTFLVEGPSRLLFAVSFSSPFVRRHLLMLSLGRLPMSWYPSHLCMSNLDFVIFYYTMAFWKFQKALPRFQNPSTNPQLRLASLRTLTQSVFVEIRLPLQHFWNISWKVLFLSIWSTWSDLAFLSLGNGWGQDVSTALPTISWYTKKRSFAVWLYQNRNIFQWRELFAHASWRSFRL